MATRSGSRARPAKSAGASRSRNGRDDRPSRVYHQLRTLIVEARLAPGTRLVESEIAARLGVSRTPVRSALQRLQQEGYVVASPQLQNVRLTVAPLTREDSRELFYLVGELEGLAARGAADLPASDRQTLATELRALNGAFRQEASERRPDPSRLMQLDERFHRRYVEAGAGPRLLALHDVVKPQAARYEFLYTSMLTSETPVSAGEHEVIVRAIRSGDPDAAQRAVQTNWRNAAERLATVIDRVGERGAW
ncbi:MAG TPA: GntR family transcriptional regulator [Gemmatimonadaceae bacterium]|nr:GntR family transcriptional regulator [Gemmatimonadaceae bacterium]